MPRNKGSSYETTPASKARISLRGDIDKLMDYFLLTESVRYQEFAKVWKALNFALIYAGLTENKDKKEFITDAFELVSEYLQPPFDIQRRVCALYILYGLYYTQTHYPKIKIRMCLEDWKETLALHDDLQEQGHLDALYIFHKMRLDKAFKFTATRCPMFYQGRSKKPEEDFERWAARHQGFMASVLDEDLLQELEQYHGDYQKGKQSCGLHGDASMAIVQDSMSDFIMERITNIDVPREPDSEDELLTESHKRSSRIRELKSKSFASPAQLSRARRARDTDADSGTDDPTFNPSSFSPPSRSKRKKIKKVKKNHGRPRKSVAEKTTKLESSSFNSPSRMSLDSEESSSSFLKKSPLKSPSEDADELLGKSKNSEELATPNGTEAGGSSSSSSPKKKKGTTKKKGVSSSPKKRKSSTANESEESSPSKKRKTGSDGKANKRSMKRKSSSANDGEESSPSKKVKRGSVDKGETSKKKKSSTDDADKESSSPASKKKKRRSQKKDSAVVESQGDKTDQSKSKTGETSGKSKKTERASESSPSSKKSKKGSPKVKFTKEKSKTTEKKKREKSAKSPNGDRKKHKAETTKNSSKMVKKKKEEVEKRVKKEPVEEARKTRQTAERTQQELSASLSPRKRPRKSSTPRRRVGSNEDDDQEEQGGSGQRSLRSSERAKKV